MGFVIKNSVVNLIYADGELTLPKETYEKKEYIKRKPKAHRLIQSKVIETFSGLDRDDSISEFGVTPYSDDEEPLVNIPRKEFGRISRIEIIEDEDEVKVVYTNEELQILRAILERSNRMWQFLWNGFKISAPIVHQKFYDDFFSREITIAPGDTLSVKLKIIKTLDKDTMLYINSGYEVVEVYDHTPSAKQLIINS